MKIAIFTDTFTPQVNGVAKTLERFTRYLAQQNIEYYVFAPENPAEEHVMTNVKKLKSIPLALYPECRLAIPNPIRLKRELLQFKPDIIHVATPFNMGLCGMYYAKKLNIPLVGSYHTDFDAYLQYYKMEFFSNMLWNYLKWFHSSLQKTFVPSLETLKQLKRKGFCDLHIWSRGVDCNLYHPHYDSNIVRERYDIKEEHIICWVGRIAPEKDIETLTHIINKLHIKRANSIHWLLVGDGPASADLKEACTENVTFTGYLKGEDLAAIYATSSLMVFPSSTETFGNVVLESLACGTPVIGADAGGVKNIITHGKNGMLCFPKQADLFINAIETLLDDYNLRQEMRQHAQEYALSQSWDSIFANLLKHYEDAIEAPQEELLA
ncbi:glycosyltransferase family 1 protein [Ectobacillus antri]|jgi:glycosyltransferase involved in cell wall biosynthesis|uniref:Glycosyltransferase family 1 protein n=1 Tax=Ectobacillus antri TaxID=2486280 RepID=A0ABT6H454_9BACI|nr:glycosyltransferase family 1 protein [Ectobacillus antri]MDG4656449.1 glycosyltransferase family 1 protein [Ectobacillus antri]MDG5753499.1 glycosyltransferase family 1 protein [Ectobacillus antri]